MLDFANEEADTYQAFKPYYESTPVGDNADPQRLSELQYRLLEWAIFTPEDVTAFARSGIEASATTRRAIIR